MKSDANEGIQNIVYDTFLKQPTEVQLFDGRKIKNYYDGGGTLLKTVYYSAQNTVIETWEFRQGMIFKNGLPYQLTTPEGRAVFNPSDSTWHYEFDYKDHLGNTRVSFRDSSGVLVKTAETAFDPYGVRLNGIGSVNSFQNRYEMQGHEKEFTFGLNRINFGARTLNPTTGVWDRIDPLADHPNQVRFSPYVLSNNNPLRFIDPDGAFPIDIYLRSFAPFKSFGAGLWHGDNRGFSTSQNVSSRISQVTSYETTTQEGNTRAYGGFSSSKYGAMAYSEASLNGGKQSVNTKGNNISTHLYGNNDALLPSMSPGTLPPDGGPTWDIDLHSKLNINISNGENGNQILNISGSVSGDAFPSAEAFVSGKGADGKPVSVFLNVAAAAYDGNTGPFVALAGDNKRPMMNINTSIIVNSSGQFTGVMQGNKVISIQDWNKNFEQKKP